MIIPEEGYIIVTDKNAIIKKNWKLYADSPQWHTVEHLICVGDRIGDWIYIFERPCIVKPKYFDEI